MAGEHWARAVVSRSPRETGQARAAKGRASVRPGPLENAGPAGAEKVLPLRAGGL